MNILQINSHGHLRSGGGIQMLRLSQALAKRGHNVTAVYVEMPDFEDDFRDINKGEINLKFLPLDKLKINLRSLRNILNLRKFIKENDFDIIHAHKGLVVDSLFFASLGVNIPIVTNRGMTSPLTWYSSLKYRLGKVKKIIAVSQAVKDVMVKTGRINPKKIEVVYGSVDINHYDKNMKSSIRNEFNISDDRQVIGFVGNSAEKKGLKFLLEAFQKVHNKYPKTGLLLVGVDEQSIKNFSSVKGIEKNIFCAGFRRDVPNCLAGMDIFVFPGIQEEGLTGTVREAAAMGLPIITTNIGGNVELIHNLKNGLVVEMRKAEAIANAIMFYLQYPEIAKEFGKESRKFVEEHMNNEIRAKKIEKVYKEVLLEKEKAIKKKKDIKHGFDEFGKPKF